MPINEVPLCVRPLSHNGTSFIGISMPGNRKLSLSSLKGVCQPPQGPWELQAVTMPLQTRQMELMPVLSKHQAALQYFHVRSRFHCTWWRTTKPIAGSLFWHMENPPHQPHWLNPDPIILRETGPPFLGMAPASTFTATWAFTVSGSGLGLGLASAKNPRVVRTRATVNLILKARRVD